MFVAPLVRKMAGITTKLRSRKNYKKAYPKIFAYCSDFRYESNGIFVLGVGFLFLQTNFDFLTEFLTEFFYIIRKVLLS